MAYAAVGKVVLFHNVRLPVMVTETLTDMMAREQPWPGDRRLSAAQKQALYRWLLYGFPRAVETAQSAEEGERSGGQSVKQSGERSEGQGAGLSGEEGERSGGQREEQSGERGEGQGAGQSGEEGERSGGQSAEQSGERCVGQGAGQSGEEGGGSGEEDTESGRDEKTGGDAVPGFQPSDTTA